MKRLYWDKTNTTKEKLHYPHKLHCTSAPHNGLNQRKHSDKTDQKAKYEEVREMN